MDDLGNRTTVNLRSGANQVYATDTPNITNRYTSVGGQPLVYDAAGNLTQDHDGYRYVYDYENRITRIFKLNGQTEIDVAQYAYDALGRRIGKYDAASLETTFYYYYDQWQILAEYTDDTTCRQWFTYGNYIDEVLSRNTHPYGLILAMQYYAHDHLYSPAALLDDTGAVVERYEYDAYGKVTITGRGADNLWYMADDVTLSASAYNNPFTFTGRQLDILDNGNLHHMHYRHRDFSPKLGRFLQHDPLGVVPNSVTQNFFWPLIQYNDSRNAYEYVISHPFNTLDPYGLVRWDCVVCLMAITAKFGGALGGAAYYCPSDNPNISWGACVWQVMKEYASGDELCDAFENNPAEWAGATICLICGLNIIKDLTCGDDGGPCDWDYDPAPPEMPREEETPNIPFPAPLPKKLPKAA